MKRHAGIYLRAGTVFVFSVHGMVSGHRGLDDAVAFGADDAEGIGSALRAKLDGYQDDAPVPRWDLMKGDQFPNLHAAAGVRSSSEFVKGAKHLSVVSDAGQITLIPYKKDGPGFSPVRGCDRTLSDALSDAEIGTAVFAAFADAQ